MDTNAVFFAWNRSIPGREHLSAEHFGQFVHYLDGLQKSAAIDSYEVVFLDPHGGDMNGFFLIRASGAKLTALLGSTAWVTHMTRVVHHLEGAGVIRGVTGALVGERMELWTKTIAA